MPKRKPIKIDIKKPPSEITFIPPDSILIPYPKEIRLKSCDEDSIMRFKKYIKDGINWTRQERKNNNPYARFPSEALAVNNIRIKVKEWRDNDYPNTTETTKYLLDFWFNYPRDKPFWFSQREAVETLIYLYEVEGIKNVSEIINKFGAFPIFGYEEYDKYPRYAFRMATGSGKTLTMALITVWSFFNYLYESNNYARFFLFVAPNIIVYDRLKRDIENLSIFNEFNLIPPDWKNDFKIQIITRDTFSDADRFPPPEDEGVIFITNIHQIGFQKTRRKKEDILESLIGIPNPGKDPYKATSIKLWDILINYPNIMILKDEAHHIHREESSWQKYIWELNKKLISKHNKGIFMELDFSATPKNERGELFPWIIVDFSLREALQTGIIKYPTKVDVKDAPPIKKGFKIEDLQPYIKVALDRWRKHKEKLKELGKKSVLFVMADETETAELIYEELLKEPDIDASNMLLIHSNLDEWKAKIKEKGKEIVSKIIIDGKEKELNKDLAVELVRNIDNPNNPIEVVVSVMMLNEGWDVRSVTVILGLRSYSSEREILPEQVIGRGLRKLFPNEGIDLERWINILEVVGPSNLLKVIDNLKKLEGIKIPEAPNKFFISFVPREDIAFKIPKGEFVSYVEEIDIEKIIEEIFSKLPNNVFNASEIEELKKIYEYEVVDLEGTTLDRGTIIGDLNIPIIKITKLARDLEELIPLPNSYALLMNKLEEYIEERLFDKKIELNERVIKFLIYKGWFNKIKNDILNIAKGTINNPVMSSKVEIDEFISLNDIDGFPWSRDFVDSDKSLFARITYDENENEIKIPSAPVDNNMEADFVRFLTRAEDVIHFIKNLRHVTKLGISYYDSRERKWRKFYPDFIVKAKDGYYLIETKGREEIQVPDKNISAKKWCEAISKATNEKWIYLYLREGDWTGKNKLSDLK